MGSGGAVEVTNSASASSFASAGSDIIDAGDGDNLVAGDAMSFTAGATLLITATADADGASHAGDDIITTGSGADTIGGEVDSSGSAAATNRAGQTTTDERRGGKEGVNT